ncbi:MAG: cytochrome c [Pseudomonadota bacterium]
MKQRLAIACALTLCATITLAHTGVKNAAVLARMHGMKTIADNVKVLGSMSKGQVAFDAKSARAAAAAIESHAAQSIALFTPKESDPKSEALPAIWENFDDFTAKARDLEAVAGELAISLESLEDVRAAMGRIGATCKACHAIYRE